MYVCVCHAITESDLKQAMENGDTSVSTLRRRFSADKRCCGRCTECMKDMLGEHAKGQQKRTCAGCQTISAT